MNIVSPGGEDGGGGGGKASNLRMTGQNVTITAANIRLEAQQEIIFSCGDSTLKITPGRIEILSPEDRLNC